MKKLFFLIIVLLMSSALLAQGSKENTATKKSFLAVHAGPSFPVGKYSSKSLTNAGFGEGAFANTGFAINIDYGYRFAEYAGLSVAAFYNNNKLDNQAFIDELNALYQGEVNLGGIKMDHWQWYGVAVGPALCYDLAPNVAADLKIMGGIANVNSPKLTYSGLTLMKEDWAIAPVLQAGVSVRIGVGKNMFIHTALNYQYMKPKFNTEFTDPDTEQLVTQAASQKMSVLNLTGGLGINF